MNLSCIIVNYHNSISLKNCLASIYRTLQKISFEVIVVDNSQNDPGIESLIEFYPQIQLIQNAVNVGFAKANNQAVKLSQGKTLLFLKVKFFLSLPL